MPVTGIVAGNWKIGNTVVVICIFSLKCSTKIILIYESFSTFVFHHCPPLSLSLQPRGGSAYVMEIYDHDEVLFSL